MMKNKIQVLKQVSILIDKATEVHTVHSSVTKEFGLYLLSEWTTLAKKVMEKADKVKQTESSVDKFLKYTDKIMGQYPDNVKDEIFNHVEFLYKYSRERFIKQNKLKIVQKVDLPEVTATIWLESDQRAIEAIDRIINGSTGKFYKNSVRAAVYESVKKNMLEGKMTSTQAIEVMKRDLAKALKLKSGQLESKVVPQGFRGTADQYFKGLAEHTATMSRTTSDVYTLTYVEAKYMVIWSVRSPRTCIGCLAMDGKRFLVSEAVTHVEKILGANSSEELGQIQPSFHFKADGENSASKVQEAKEKALSKTVEVPPFHWRCECYVDMD